MDQHPPQPAPIIRPYESRTAPFSHFSIAKSKNRCLLKTPTANFLIQHPTNRISRPVLRIPPGSTQPAIVPLRLISEALALRSPLPDLLRFSPLTMSLAQPMSFYDDIGAVYLARMGPDAKTPLPEATTTAAVTRKSSTRIMSMPPPSTTTTAGTHLPSPPPLPKRNSLRRSRLLEAFGLHAAASASSAPRNAPVASAAVLSAAVTVTSKTDASPQPTPTPHDIYLSSEEDASSAEDLSDEYDDEDVDMDFEKISPRTSLAHLDRPVSPHSTPEPAPVQRHSRRSHDKEARVVSVIYSGKPCLIDLAVKREARHRSCIEPVTRLALSSSASSDSAASSYRLGVSMSGETRSSVSSESLASSHSNGSVLASFRQRKNSTTTVTTTAVPPNPGPVQSPPLDHPRFIQRSFTAPISDFPNATPAPTAPPAHHSRPHGAALFRGVTRTLTLSRRRSRPALRDESASHPVLPSPSVCVTPPLRTPTPAPVPVPVTYNDIVRSARRKSLAAAAAPPIPPIPASSLHVPDEQPRMPPRKGSTGGFLGNLAARRRSLKIVL